MFRNNQDLAVEIVTDIQLFQKGQNSFGESLGSYSPFTIGEKQSKGQPIDRVTLRDTGDYHNQVFADTRKFPIPFGSRDSKAQELFQRYDDHLNLSEQTGVPIYTKKTEDELIKEIQKSLLGIVQID